MGALALLLAICAPPDGSQMHMERPACDPEAPCFPGRPLSFTIQPNASCYPRWIPCPGYSIQACDTINWSFGDGTTATTQGDPNIAHTYAAPGLYSIEAIVTNPSGSGYVHEAVIVAQEPLVLVSFENALYHVDERAGSVTATVRRSGDTTRAVSVGYNAHYTAGIRGTITFEPGQATIPLTVPIIDDDVYTGDAYHYLYIECYTGEALISPGTFMDATTIHVIDDERPATAAAPQNVSVAEGDSGAALLRIPVTLSKPFTEEIHFWWTLWEGSAKREIDWRAPDGYVMSGDVTVPAGSTSAEFAVQILGDTLPEPDEQFTLEFVRSGGPALVIEGSPVTITILDDDVVVHEPFIPSFEPSYVEVREQDSVMAMLTVDPLPDQPLRALLMTQQPSIIGVPSSVEISKEGIATFPVTGRAPGKGSVIATLPDVPGQPAVALTVQVLAKSETAKRRAIRK